MDEDVHEYTQKIKNVVQMLDKVVDAIKIWDEIEHTTPKVIRKNSVRKIMLTDVQLGKDSIEFIDFVVYVLIKFIAAEAKDRGMKRLSVAHIRDIMTENDKETPETDIPEIVKDFQKLEDRILDRIYKKMAEDSPDDTEFPEVVEDGDDE